MSQNLAVPLRSTEDKERAQENFERQFTMASDDKNPYLQGKYSAAFRICVDPQWDDSSRQSVYFKPKNNGNG